MKIKSIKLENIGQFDNLEMDLSSTSNIVVLIGNNGAGKTSILKSIATGLSWFVARLKTEKGVGQNFPEDVIFNEAATASFDIKVQLNNAVEEFEWRITKTRKGRESSQQNRLQQATALAKYFRQMLESEKANLPLIAFYPVERSVLDIPLKIKGKHSFSQIDGYDNSLNQGIDFRRFFEWFREREDIENENIVALLDENKPIEKIEKDAQLNSVREAIGSFMDGFKDLRVKRKPKLHMSVNKDGKLLNVSQLSQGEKSLMALVGDIARRLVMMNPSLSNPLAGEGIVLIDEIDMHLHPQWQRKILARLKNTFPNCQFILTTHSPLVISDCKDILVYSLENGEIDRVSSQYGQDVNSVLLEVMNTDIRNSFIEDKFNKLIKDIQNKEFDKAKDILAQLEQEVNMNNIELIKAKLFLRKMEAISNAKNN